MAPRLSIFLLLALLGLSVWANKEIQKMDDQTDNGYTTNVKVHKKQIKWNSKIAINKTMNEEYKSHHHKKTLHEFEEDFRITSHEHSLNKTSHGNGESYYNKKNKTISFDEYKDHRKDMNDEDEEEPERKLAVSSKLLYWLPNGAGLFSLFLQLRIMYDLALEHGKELFASFTSSPHYGSQKLNLCSWFKLPYQIHCGHLPTGMVCAHKPFKKTMLPHCVCTVAAIMPVNNTRRQAMVRAAQSSTLPFALHPKLLALARLYHASVRSLGNNSLPLTVVHWRRGDQLISRCQQQMDLSVNCANATDLIKQVQSLLPKDKKSLVFIATNEPQNSKDMRALRAAGFLTYISVEGDLYVNASLLQILAIEVELMMQADTFLAWGISEVNDVVEIERRKAGKSYCVGHNMDQSDVGWQGDLSYCSQLQMDGQLSRKLL
jgi:hypothetical protein